MHQAPTYDLLAAGVHSDDHADGVLEFGFNHQQLVDVASLYGDLKRKYGSNIALTGQSLGGGLAVAIAICASAANDES